MMMQHPLLSSFINLLHYFLYSNLNIRLNLIKIALWSSVFLVLKIEKVVLEFCVKDTLF